jgi:Asp-tRNA(Asn)/Glu-tRNA(Gln) amidotransferase A subunit family amidase
VQPALRAALYCLKPTVGTTDLRGSQAEGSKVTSLGRLARTTKDLADLTSVLLPGRTFDSFQTGSWKGIKIAVVDPVAWHYPDSVSERNSDFDRQSVCIATLSHKLVLTTSARRNGGSAPESGIS